MTNESLKYFGYTPYCHLTKYWKKTSLRVHENKVITYVSTIQYAVYTIT